MFNKEFNSLSGNYFIRYSEHGTPFDSGLDETLTEEDIMLSIGDGASGYFSEESDEEERKNDLVDEFSDENADKYDFFSNFIRI